MSKDFLKTLARHFIKKFQNIFDFEIAPVITTHWKFKMTESGSVSQKTSGKLAQ
jgi:hypothetical protein